MLWLHAENAAGTHLYSPNYIRSNNLDRNGPLRLVKSNRLAVKIDLLPVFGQPA
ncbi:MAG: hypothetical protein L6461_02960 [Anaerolineae bacterium]|nr:hypothetical protein [Anaerolineae bacterium]